MYAAPVVVKVCEKGTHVIAIAILLQFAQVIYISHSSEFVFILDVVQIVSNCAHLYFLSRWGFHVTTC